MTRLKAEHLSCWNFVYSTSAQVIRGNIDLNKNFSSTPAIFKFTLDENSIPIDLTGINIMMTHSASGDDGKFGGITAISKGLLFRKENH
jgi:hypothetical protein